jgi:hypothetical protein
LRIALKIYEQIAAGIRLRFSATSETLGQHRGLASTVCVALTRRVDQQSCRVYVARDMAELLGFTVAEFLRCQSKRTQQAGGDMDCDVAGRKPVPQAVQ